MKSFLRYLLIPLFLLVTCSAAYAQPIQKIEDADFAVLSKLQLLNALAVADSGQTVYVADDLVLDMSDTSDVIIPGGVRLLTLGAEIVYNAHFDDGSFKGLFKTGGPGVYIGCDQQCQRGFKITGYNCDTEPILENGIRQAAYAIQLAHPGATIRGNQISCFGKWSLYAKNIRDHWIVNNLFMNSKEEGYGYGVWLAGDEIAPIDSANTTLIEANLFVGHRNSVDRGSQDFNSVRIFDNVSFNVIQSHFDTHSSGGHDSWIYRNLCMTKGPCARVTGHPEGEFWFVNNITQQWSENSMIWFSGDAVRDSSNIHIIDNEIRFGRGY